MSVKEIIKLIEREPCPWNALQTPDWHLHQWKTSLIEAIKKHEKASGN